MHKILFCFVEKVCNDLIKFRRIRFYGMEVMQRTQSIEGFSNQIYSVALKTEKKLIKLS